MLAVEPVIVVIQTVKLAVEKIVLALEITVLVVESAALAVECFFNISVPYLIPSL